MKSSYRKKARKQKKTTQKVLKHTESTDPESSGESMGISKTNLDGETDQMTFSKKEDSSSTSSTISKLGLTTSCGSQGDRDDELKALFDVIPSQVGRNQMEIPLDNEKAEATPLFSLDLDESSQDRGEELLSSGSHSPALPEIPLTNEPPEKKRLDFQIVEQPKQVQRKAYEYENRY
jgi:hypothetical protein